MKLVRPADASALGRLLESLTQAQPTYERTGATLVGELPSGFRHDRYQAVLGKGEVTYQRAAEGLRAWQAHCQHGLRVVPIATEIRVGSTVLVLLGSHRLAIAAPCRVVGVIDEPSRWGFAYGSLPGHPEQGEEAFVTSIAEDGSVTFEITSFSRPADSILRLSGPVGRALQQVGSYGYLRALRRYVDL
jgi:uncharacterized protein (UPF0548 family)